MASTKARKAEAKANASSGLISIKIGDTAGTGGGGGFKKGGFKKAGFKSAFAPPEPEGRNDDGEEKRIEKDVKVLREGEEMESDTDEEDYEHYDPRFPTD
jgi:hypothetical protein